MVKRNVQQMPAFHNGLGDSVRVQVEVMCARAAENYDFRKPEVKNDGHIQFRSWLHRSTKDMQWFNEWEWTCNHRSQVLRLDPTISLFGLLLK